MTQSLILERASASRSAGEWHDALLHANLPRFKVAAARALEGVQIVVGLFSPLDAD
jgi:hypothetical protein